jgi:hypothetical protein
MHTHRKWTPPVSTPIPDIHGWLDDISGSREFAERLHREAEAPNPDACLLDALSAAAIVRYCRCFTTGLRDRLTIEQLPLASAAEIDFHSRIRGVRDWHISHAVNQQEAHALYVIIDESPGATTGALDFSSRATSQIPLTPEDAREMVALCDKWIIWLRDRLAQEHARLIPLATRLSREELLSLPQDEPQSNEDINAKRPRSALRPNKSLERTREG